jgi:biopolymer transport protein ExbD
MSRKRSRETPSFDLTPLIDVVFLLLIFFMVTTVFKKDESILELNLPTADVDGGGQQKKQKRINIELNEKELAVNGKKFTIEDFKKYLDDVKNKQTPVDLKVDKKVAYERLVQVLESLQKRNLTNLSLITTQ